jgi:hypothetical protein
MKKFKLIVLLLFLIIGVQKMNAQVYKFVATGFSVLEKEEKGNWGKWSDYETTNIVIALDLDKKRIVVYSKEIQFYNINKFDKKIENDDDLIFPFSCNDIDNEPFTISFITRKKQDNRKQLYINQKDVILVYNIVNFPENNK